MDKQQNLSFYTDELKEAKTRKKEFLAKMEKAIPWKELEELIRPYYYKGERGQKPYDLGLMVRIHILQNLYDLSDEGAMNEVMDSRAFSEFCGVESTNQMPDGDTIGRFRNLLTKNGIQKKFFELVLGDIEKRGLVVKRGTIVDSTFIEAPSSTKNKEKKRDEDAGSGKKGTVWHFGYKAHVGVDKDTGIVKRLEVTDASVHDVTVTSKLVTGDEEVVCGDSGYMGAEKREDAVLKNKEGKEIKYVISRRPKSYMRKGEEEAARIKREEKQKASARAKVEHVFAIVKGVLRYRKTRYKGMEKQKARLNMTFALANLILSTRPSVIQRAEKARG